MHYLLPLLFSAICLIQGSINAAIAVFVFYMSYAGFIYLAMWITKTQNRTFYAALGAFNWTLLVMILIGAAAGMFLVKSMPNINVSFNMSASDIVNVIGAFGYVLYILPFIILAVFIKIGVGSEWLRSFATSVIGFVLMIITYQVAPSLLSSLS